MDFNKVIKINKSKLNDELASYSEEYYFFGVKKEKIWSKREEIKSQIKRLESEKATLIRSKYQRTRKPFTETQIKDTLKADKELISKQEEFIKYEKLYRLASLRMDALDKKGIMLANINNNLKKEGN